MLLSMLLIFGEDMRQCFRFSGGKTAFSWVLLLLLQHKSMYIIDVYLSLSENTG